MKEFKKWFASAYFPVKNQVTKIVEIHSFFDAFLLKISDIFTSMKAIKET
jgi:hypothetical protein